MLEQVLKSAGAEIVSQLGSKFGLDASKGKGVMNVAGDTIKEGLLSEVTSGKLDGVLSLLNGKTSAAGSTLTNKLTSSMVGGLIEKIGLKGDVAKSVATFVIPLIIQQFTKKKPTGGFDSGSLMDMITGSATNSLKDKASDLLKGGFGKLFK